MLTIFTTGGTFDKIYFDANSEFSIGEPMVDPILKEAGVSLTFSIEPVLRKDSLEITDEDRQLLCGRVAACESQQIVITHGTDTMVVTAKALADQELKDKTIVLLGAMQPARMRYTDAPFNLGFGIAAAQLSSPGIYIAMNGRLFPHDKVAKNYQAQQFQSTD